MVWVKFGENNLTIKNLEEFRDYEYIGGLGVGGVLGYKTAVYG